MSRPQHKRHIKLSNKKTTAYQLDAFRSCRFPRCAFSQCPFFRPFSDDVRVFRGSFADVLDMELNLNNPFEILSARTAKKKKPEEKDRKKRGAAKTEQNLRLEQAIFSWT